VYEAGALLDSGSYVLSASGWNASGWETRTGEVGTENASCVEENTWSFRERWEVSKEKREVSQPMPGVQQFLWRRRMSWN